MATHPIGEHALLADGRTAALVAPDGEVAWMCWPRVDSIPRFLSLLDSHRGGTFAVRPDHPDARVVHRGYISQTLVLATTWRLGDAEVVVEECLAWDGPLRLLRRVCGLKGSMPMVAQFSLPPSADGVPVALMLNDDSVVAATPTGELLVSGPATWTFDTNKVACCRWTADAGQLSMVALSDPRERLAPESAYQLFDATISRWQTVTAPVAAVQDEQNLGVQAVGEHSAHELLNTSACVLLGLLQRGGGIVAAPTTSIPQWPGSSRTWDYRYSWMRDSSLAAMALLRLGFVDAASSLADFCGAASASGEPPTLVRVDGTSPPQERVLSYLEGYGGAQPVRIGNAAADMVQLDVIGELLELARALHDASALPDRLREAAPRLADTAMRRWWEPDYGIWEIRGQARRYTHSRVMVWAALHCATQLARNGAIVGNADEWERAAAELHASVLQHCLDERGALQLHDEGGGPDAALSMTGLVGFFPRDDAHLRATLESIAQRLVHGGLIDRYEGQPDGIPDPCAPFVFPTFWFAQALQDNDGDGRETFARAAGTCGPLHLFGEVSHPDDGTPLGNYPQVQSHAAGVMASLHVGAGAAVA